MAHHDPLTDLPNRAAFSECIACDGRTRDGGERKLRPAVHGPRPLQGGQRRVRPRRRRRAAARGRRAHAGGLPGRVPGAARRRRIRRHHADRPAAGDGRGAGRAACGGARRRHRDRRSRAAQRRHHRHRHLPAGRRRRLDAGRRTPTPRCTAPSPRRAARSASSNWRWTSSCATSARCSRICARRSSATNWRCTTSRRRMIDGEITGFEALVRWHHPRARHGAARARSFRSPRKARLIVALGEWILRTACREAASWPRPLHIADQSVAGAVPARRPAEPGASRCCWRPACRRRGSSSRSPKAC